jgi:hypothetical protein
MNSDQLIPATNDTPVVRTDFDNVAAWNAICELIRQPVNDAGEDFYAYVDFVDDPIFRDLSEKELLGMVPDQFLHTFVFVVDKVATKAPEFPILVIDLSDEPGRTFPAILSANERPGRVVGDCRFEAKLSADATPECQKQSAARLSQLILPRGSLMTGRADFAVDSVASRQPRLSSRSSVALGHRLSWSLLFRLPFGIRSSQYNRHDRRSYISRSRPQQAHHQRPTVAPSARKSRKQFQPEPEELGAETTLNRGVQTPTLPGGSLQDLWEDNGWAEDRSSGGFAVPAPTPRICR